MIHHSCNITTKTATMEAWHHLENSGESAVFSRDTFAADIKVSMHNFLSVTDNFHEVLQTSLRAFLSLKNNG